MRDANVHIIRTRHQTDSTLPAFKYKVPVMSMSVEFKASERTC